MTVLLCKIVSKGDLRGSFYSTSQSFFFFSDFSNSCHPLILLYRRLLFSLGLTATVLAVHIVQGKQDFSGRTGFRSSYLFMFYFGRHNKKNVEHFLTIMLDDKTP